MKNYSALTPLGKNFILTIQKNLYDLSIFSKNLITRIMKIPYLLVCFVLFFSCSKIYADLEEESEVQNPPSPTLTSLNSPNLDDVSEEYVSLLKFTESMVLATNIATLFDSRFATFATAVNFLSACQTAYYANQSEGLSDIYWAITALKVGAVTSLSSAWNGLSQLSFLDASILFGASSFGFLMARWPKKTLSCLGTFIDKVCLYFTPELTKDVCAIMACACAFKLGSFFNSGH